MAVYTNDLRLKEIATGDESGTWGTSTNTNLSLIADAFGFGTEAITTNADTHTTTIADGSADPGRSIFLKYTGTLDSACTITIGPNTVSKLWFIENATSGSQNIIIKQGSGATVTIPAGDTKAIYSDGAGSGGAMVDAFASLNVVDLKVEDDLTFTSDSAVITFGADGDTTLTHTDGSGLTLNSTNKLMFNDASQFIQGSSATVLSLGATDEIDLTATLIDINGNADVSGTVTATGTSVFASLDISGDIDVDGTTNLDVVDIDGAVDMASTLTVGGNVTINSDTLKISGNFPELFFEDTAGSDLDAYIVNNANGLFIGKTNSPSSSNDIMSFDLTNQIVGIGGAAAFSTFEVIGDKTESNNLQLTLKGSTNTNKQMIMGFDTTADTAHVTTQIAGSAPTPLIFKTGNVVFNESSTDSDFRVESDGSTHALFVQASDGNVGFNKSSPAMGIDLVAANNSQLRIDSSDTNDTTLFFDYNGGGATNRIRLRNAAGAFAINVDNTNEAMRIDSSANIQFAGVSSNTTVLSLNTSDGSDNKQLSLAGGGADSDGRGARIRLMGNEHASLGGDCDISTGNASGAQLDLKATGSQIFTTASVEHMKLDGSVVINEGGADLDVRIESTGFANQFMLDAGNNAIGIGRVPSSMVLDLESASSGTLNAFRIRNSATAAAAEVKMHFSLNRTGSDVDFEVASIVAGKEQEFTTTASTVDGFMAFRTIQNETTAERMRIDSSGNLLVKKTGFLDSQVGVYLGANGQVGATRSSSSDSDLNYILYSTGANQYQFYVGMAGTVFARATSISGLSDETLKENIRDLDSGLSDVMALKPRRFDWVDNDEKNVVGFVAQEVEQVLPKLVTDYVYSKDESGDHIIKKGLKMGDMIPTLVKAIQEQQAQIETLQAEVAELKGE